MSAPDFTGWRFVRWFINAAIFVGCAGIMGLIAWGNVWH